MACAPIERELWFLGKCGDWAFGDAKNGLWGRWAGAWNQEPEAARQGALPLMPGARHLGNRRGWRWPVDAGATSGGRRGPVSGPRYPARLSLAVDAGGRAQKAYQRRSQG